MLSLAGSGREAADRLAETCRRRLRRRCGRRRRRHVRVRSAHYRNSGTASQWQYGRVGDQFFGQKLVFGGGATGLTGYVVNPGASAQVQLYFTGSKGHNIKLRQRALNRGWTLNEYALSEIEGGKVIASETEEEIYAALGLAWIPPVLPKHHTHAQTLLAAMEAQTVAVERLARKLHAEAVYERFSLFSTAGVRAAEALGIPHLLEVNAPLRDEAARFRVLPHGAVAEQAEQQVFARSANTCCSSSDSANVRRLKVTPIRCGPAVAAKRMFFRRALTRSRAPLCT